MIHHLLGNMHNTELWASYLPRVPKSLALLAVGGIAAITLPIAGLPDQPVWSAIGAAVGGLLILPALAAGVASTFKWAYGLRLRRQILDMVEWRGDEAVLDVGCGSGMLLNGAARRLTNGKAIGIDIWASSGGGGNLALLVSSARAEGVAGRIEFKEADARDMPFGDAEFDVVMSSGALHHISRSPEDFEKVVREMARVLMPGGRMLIWDVAHMVDVMASRLHGMGIPCETQAAGKYLGFEMRLLSGAKADGAKPIKSHSAQAADHAFVSYH